MESQAIHNNPNNLGHISSCVLFVHEVPYIDNGDQEAKQQQGAEILKRHSGRVECIITSNSVGRQQAYKNKPTARLFEERRINATKVQIRLLLDPLHRD
jgi:hypothetical protein